MKRTVTNWQMEFLQYLLEKLRLVNDNIINVKDDYPPLKETTLRARI